jgi:hypothetical protein
MSRDGRLADLRALFRQYAEKGFPGAGAHLYAAIASEICDDDEVLSLTRGAQPGQPAPNMLFGAVHYLLLRGAQHPLREPYADVAPQPVPHAGAGARFRDFCLAHGDDVEALVRERRVQTNVLERCGALLPAFAVAAEWLGTRDLAVVEIGASAGLNLLWDRFAYRYSNGTSWGDAASGVQLEIEVRGGRALPAIPPDLRSAWRAGMDLRPVDLTDADELLWQRALMWPERVDRQRRLAAAAPLLREAGVRIRAGDAVELLPAMLDEASADAGLLVVASHTLYQVPDRARARVDDVVRAPGERRRVALVTMDMNMKELSDLGSIELVRFDAGGVETRTLAQGHPHGAWIEWLAGDD